MASRRVPLFVALCFITIVAQQSIEALGSASAGEPTDTKAAETRCQISSETASSASEPAADQQSFLTARSSSVLENEVAGQGDVEPQEKDGIAQGSGAGHRLPQGSTRRRDQAFAYGGYYSYGAGFPGFMPYGGYGIFWRLSEDAWFRFPVLIWKGDKSALIQARALAAYCFNRLGLASAICVSNELMKLSLTSKVTFKMFCPKGANRRRRVCWIPEMISQFFSLSVRGTEGKNLDGVYNEGARTPKSD